MINDAQTPDDQTPDESAHPPIGAEEGPPAAESEAKASCAPDNDALQAELADARDRLLRALAEADNARKRAERDVADARVYSVTAFARDMISVADNLSRALTALTPEVRATMGDAGRQLLEGVELTERELLVVFDRHGVGRLDPSAGDRFDPNWHQAAAHFPSDQPSGTIAATMQVGWRLGDRALRPAIVAVSSGPANTGEQPPSNGGAAPGSHVDTKV